MSERSVQDKKENELIQVKGCHGGAFGLARGLSAGNPRQAQGTAVGSSDPPLRQSEPAKNNKNNNDKSFSQVKGKANVEIISY